MNKTLTLLLGGLLFAAGANLQAQTLSYSSSSLADVAAHLSAGEWGEVTGMSNLYPTTEAGPASWGATILNSDNAQAADDSILQFSNKWLWNPQTREAFVIGGSHPSTCTGHTPPDCQIIFDKFSADTGAWTRLALPTTSCVAYLNNSGTHMYGSMTIDPVNQDIYAMLFTYCGTSEMRVWQYHIPDATWTVLPHIYPLDAYQYSQLDALEYLPATKQLILLGEANDSDHAAIVMVQWNAAVGGWQYFNNQNSPTFPVAGTQGYFLHGGWQLTTAHYDPIHQILYAGGGGAADFSPPPSIVDAPNQLWGIQVCGYTFSSSTCDKTMAQAPPYQLMTTALPTTGGPAAINVQNGIDTIDPVTGDFLQFIAPFSSGTTCATGLGSLVLNSYHQGDSSWQTTDISPTSGQSFLCQNGNANYPMYQIVATPTDEQFGVILFLEQISTTSVRLFVYKRSQRPSFDSKCADSHVLNCWHFNSQTDIDLNHQAMRYTWTSPNTWLDSDPLLTGQTNYGFTGWRDAGEGNAKAYNMFATPQVCRSGTAGSCDSIPTIDTSVKFDGAGSLTIPMRQYNVEETAEFEDNLDGNLGHPNVAICKGDLTNCPQGDVLWMQYRVMFTPNLMEFVDECWPSIPGSCYNGGAQGHQVNDGAGTTADKTMDCSSCENTGDQTKGFCIATGNPSGCPGSQAGKSLYLFNSQSGSGCVAGIYTMVTINAYNQVVLDRSPSVVGQQCSDGVFLGEGLGTSAEAWKLSLAVSNALPIGVDPAGNCECLGEVFTRGNQTFSPALNVYDSKGTNQPGLPQQNYLFRPYTWYEVTKEIIVGDINVANTEVKWWINGQLAYDWTTGVLDLSGSTNPDHGYGLGQVQLMLYTTRGDPFFARSGDGQVWYDNLITSTGPIPFDSDGGGDLPVCSSPSKVVFTSQPSNALLGASLGTVVAQIQDSSNVLCTSATDTVTLSKNGSATWGTLQSGSSLSKAASGGVVTWNDLSVATTAGAGSIDANASGLTGATSNSITISNPSSSSHSGAFRLRP